MKMRFRLTVECEVLEDLTAAMTVIELEHGDSPPEGEVTMVAEQVYTFDDEPTTEDENGKD